jgi:hypothetical protein
MILAKARWFGLYSAVRGNDVYFTDFTAGLLSDTPRDAGVDRGVRSRTFFTQRCEGSSRARCAPIAANIVNPNRRVVS